MSQETIQGYRLSPQQKHLWLRQQAELDQPYRVRCAIELEGELDVSALQQSLDHVAGQYEILRTSFQLLPGMTVPVQVIAAESVVPLHRYDLTHSPPDEQTAKIDQLFSAAGNCRTDYTRPSLLRADLVNQSNRRSQLIISAPALCLDGLSLQIALREIVRVYAAQQGGEVLPSVEAMQYADFAEWQNELLESSEGATAVHYWQQHDLSSSFARALPFEQSGPADSFQVSAAAVEIPVATIKRARDVSAACEVPVSLFLLACWQTVLWRAIGCDDRGDDVTVWVELTGRKFAELEHAVGLLSVYLPLTSSLIDDLPFKDLLHRLHGQQHEAERWQEYFSWDRPVSDAGSIQFSPFCFEVRRRPAEINGGELRFSCVRQDACTGRFKIKLVCEEREGGLALELQYDANLIAADDLRRLSRRLETFIEAAAAGPELQLADLDVLGVEERRLLLVEFNATARDFPAGACIHDLFEAQAEKSPDRVAVVFEDDQLTFRELNARANQLAHHLLHRGIGPDVPVGLCLERSVDLIVALLGILKAGGAYLPLDPGLPKSRIKLMLAEAGARVLVTQTVLAAGRDEGLEHTVCLDRDGELLAKSSTDNLPIRVSDRNLAYIIFTSGSTGTPKGVAVEHRQLVNYVNAIWERLELPDESTFASVSTIAADLGNTVLFPSLSRGGTLHLISEERATNPDALAEYCRSHPIDCLKIVPSHLAALLSAASPADLLPRRRLVVGGEACSWSLVEKIAALKPDGVVLNHYGPTEATVGVTTHRVDQNERDLGSELVPLGRPLGNAQVFILSRFAGRMQPVPLGAPGELYIGGAGVARGYINRAGTTAEKFLPNPFGAAGSRLYRTGDLARYLPGGGIEFLGRIDDQVKIHGYRIEPGEVAQALRGHPRIAESVVVAREDQPGDKRLVAYVVAQDRAPLDASELKTFLGGKLPEYMMPWRFVFLERLPLTPNGKLDRNALPAPDRSRASEAAGALPRNQIEEALAKIWAGVLGVEALGIHDNFFELGGDSILSIQIIARANQAGLKLSPRQLFQHQTIAELAAVAGTTAGVATDQGVVTGPVPLTPVQARFLAQEQPDPHHYNQAMMLNVDAALDGPTLARACEHLVIHHDALRLRFERHENSWRQAIAEPGEGTSITLETIDLENLVAEAQGAAIAEHAARLQASLNLADGPLIRVALFKRGPERPGNLLIVIHHLAVDGVSWSVLLADLQALYTQFSSGEEIELPGKTTSFKSWSEQLLKYAKSDALRDEGRYWLALSNDSVTRLPMDHELGPNTTASAHTVTASLDTDETRALLQEVPVAYRTQINEVLLTALARALTQWTKSRFALVDLEGHGREELFGGVDLTRTVGWLTTIFPVALDLKDSKTPLDALRLLKDQLRAIPNRGIGYGLLRYVSGDTEVVAGLTGLPQAEIRFNYLGQTDRALPEASLFRPAPEATGPSQSPKSARGYLLNVIGAVTNGALRLEWTYSENLHRRETIERLAQSYVTELRALITHSQKAGTEGLSPSDFPSAKLSQDELSKVLAKLGRVK